MRILKRVAILALALGLAQSCKTLKASKEVPESYKVQLTLYQNNNEYLINNLSESIEIEKNEFSLRFFNKRYDSENKRFYSAQIAAFTDKSEFDKIKINLSKTDLPCFNPGSGMAPYKSGKYESLIFDNSAHHYMIYKNSDSKRLKLLKMSGELLNLEFEVNSLYYSGKEVKMIDTDLKEFYLAFLIDKNLNGTIDKGELNKLTIKIK